MLTFLVAFLCVPIISSEYLRALILKYPELHFFTIALVLALAAYSGKKLTEYRVLRLLGARERNAEKNGRL